MKNTKLYTEIIATDLMESVIFLVLLFKVRTYFRSWYVIFVYYLPYHPTVEWNRRSTKKEKKNKHIAFVRFQTFID